MVQFSAKYKLFSLILYIKKVMGYVRNHLEVLTEQKIIHCIIYNDLNLHIVTYTDRYIYDKLVNERKHVCQNFHISVQIICEYLAFY